MAVTKAILGNCLYDKLRKGQLDTDVSTLILANVIYNVLDCEEIANREFIESRYEDLIRQCVPNTSDNTSSDTLLYGAYIFDIVKSTTLSYDVLNLDTTNYLVNYSESPYVTSIVTITTSDIFYPVIRVKYLDVITIKDEAGTDITSSFTVYSSGNYSFYVQEDIITPGTFKFAITI